MNCVSSFQKLPGSRVGNPRRATVCPIVCLLLIPVVPAMAQGVPDPPSAAQTIEIPDPSEDMSEALRASVGKAAVVAGDAPPEEVISGDYEKATPGLVGGMSEGSRLGTISQEIGGVNVNFPIPILTLPGAIAGGLSGATQRQIQDFRDALTEDLASAGSKPLTNDGLALDVFQELGRLSDLEARLFSPSAEIPQETDAILYVRFGDITIDVEGKDAILAVSANATLRDRRNGSEMYETVARYQDRDTLANWTADGNALWHDYSNFAAHYLAREIGAAVFGRLETGHVLRPKETESVRRDRKNERLFVARSAPPTLAWNFELPANDPTVAGAAVIDESDVFYDVEIYDSHRLVYAAKQVADPSHTVAEDAGLCGTLRWSARPAYRIDGEVRFGEWLRYDATESSGEVPAIGLAGRQASIAPAYTQDFPLLEIKCRRR